MSYTHEYQSVVKLLDKFSNTSILEKFLYKIFHLEYFLCQNTHWNHSV